ncbi:bifunctional proline dehydrogenase/L-glutamate gamma-semialdehyde dehydrogenase PutA [Croceicoccus marinus]|uniref:Bifunctional protein PutA n=1 Tax=Croceicoccus marinus TaxID=450378 RepID=A0A7G6VRX6_9SPHN|nr:bifunctional proline dehydrogenase/L-glutamate gamma-semialdehyde dehydrogenase PutA [Croceicoccus marinus]QNE04491.1 bifunctional proline dehydrogenase/L-glutamate gamma-semialdehyde dehydrogenase PutA [Croceicoccus marinus]
MLDRTADLNDPFARFAPPIREATPLRQAITDAYRRPEQQCFADLLPRAEMPPHLRVPIEKTARDLVTKVRKKQDGWGVEGLMQEYSLSSEEGVALMCLAEALLRIPDAGTRDALVRDKIARGNWRSHLAPDHSLFVNAATWGLVVTGELTERTDEFGLAAALKRLIGRAGEPVIRSGVRLAMEFMGEHFVAGETIDEAIRHAKGPESRGFTYSYDMLGEAAVDLNDAAAYYAAYEKAIHAIGRRADGKPVHAAPGISVKLSALHPRYQRAQAERVMKELLPRVRALAVLAKSYGIGFNIDAEEADRLELSLDIIEELAMAHELAGWDGLGCVIQAYGKRCPQTLDWLIDLAKRSDRRIPVRLVKGAYWDAEIKRAQLEGLPDFPVYTRKLHTDLSYIACARQLLNAREHIFAQFATHNAQTLATIYHLADEIKGEAFEPGDWEFQCLHGMGEELYDEVVPKKKLNRPCRIYAPVGTHETLLAYLVRRLLENGANSSFLNRISNPDVEIEDLIADPARQVAEMDRPGSMHPQISLPLGIFPMRLNSAGIDLSNEDRLADLTADLKESAQREWIAGEPGKGTPRDVTNPADRRDIVGVSHDLSPEDVAGIIDKVAASHWDEVPVSRRASALHRAADTMQAQMGVLIGLTIREAGKSVPNAIAEVREAIDFLRYYANRAVENFGHEQEPLGTICCISPWNFPLAIFTGQVAAALVGGNSVLAKPAEETPLVAAEAVRILHEAGVPDHALQLVPGPGEVGAALVASDKVQGVMFTGSTQVAQLIQKQLSKRLSPAGKPIPLIAETGGINAMIVDSSALAEQVVRDVIASAFDSAGQRCSALRLLCIQDDVYDRTLGLLKGALAQLSIGSTTQLSKDIGPVITEEALEGIEKHIAEMEAAGHKVTRLKLPPEAEHGSFVAPAIIELESTTELTREVFGPVLHVTRFSRHDLVPLVHEINMSGYGLTFGLHTRLDGTVDQVARVIEAGNIYINRNQIGAIVGSQPFGGHRLSGTGPKAGGPLYLGRLVSQPPALLMALSDPAVHQFAQWLRMRGEIAASDAARAYADQGGLGYREVLPGPVGERNTYELRKRGHILIRPKTRAGFQQQLSAVLATGNVAVLENMDWAADLPPELNGRVERLGHQMIAGALVEGNADDVGAALAEFAERDGPLVLTQSATEETCASDVPAYCLHWLLEEVSISVDTTAAGGNASLMTLE